MTSLRNLVGTFWATSDELLAADLWRFAVLVSAVLACIAVIILERRSLGIWTAARIVAIGLLALSAVVRPASVEAVILIAAALLIGVASVALPRGSSRVARPLLSVGLISLVIATASFHLTWFGSASQRAVALEEMRRRPADPWPRGAGHAMLSSFAAPVEERGWIEAGGSFSPALRTFGVSIWVTDASGTLITTSDDIALSDTRHTYRRGPGDTPAIEVTTPYYTARWTALGSNYTLDLRPNGDARLDLMFRSVGPAGGPLRSIIARPGRLELDSGWTVTLPEGAAAICLGDERSVQLLGPCPEHATASSAEGWAFARVGIGGGASHFEISRPGVEVAPPAVVPDPSGFALEGFPPAFSNRLAAQATTLLDGIVGTETRPGDPVNYPLSWQRDGAYMLVALARAGYAEQARGASEEFATKDFFGGFGSEADAPGLSLWALSEVSAALRDPAFDARIWQHIERKAALIEAMLATDGELRLPYSGPIVPHGRGRADLDLVATPADGGLIMGRMDWQWPVFFVNAVSYLGLVEAGVLAERLGHGEAATRWSNLAQALRSAYRARMSSLPVDAPEMANPRTAISGLWPADIADPEQFRALAEQRWSSSRLSEGSFAERPLWTYFALAEAHQWLRLGEVDRVLATLDWFDANDTVPGLQVFWEGNGEENSFGGWRDVRGNLAPNGVTPHFWTSAEGLLLSLEMLAYVDQDRSRLTIGGGLPPQWLDRPLSVRDVGTTVGPVSWQWNGRQCVAVDAPAGLSLTTGPNFPDGTVIVTPPAACPD